MTSASANETNGQRTSYASSLVRKAQLQARYPHLRIVLQGFWVAVVPGSLLRYEPRGVRPSRWRLGCLCDDIEAAIEATGAGTGKRLTLDVADPELRCPRAHGRPGYRD